MYSFIKVIDGGLYTNYSFTKRSKNLFYLTFVKVNKNVDKRYKTGEYTKDTKRKGFSHLCYSFHFV